MTRAYLFVDSIREQEAISVCFSDDGSIQSLLAKRSLQDYNTIVGEGESILVLPSTWASIYRVELPKLSPQKAKNALLFALEEQIAQPIDEVHIAFRSISQNPHCYEIAVIQKKQMETVFSLVESEGLLVSAITLDCFALKEDEAVIFPQTILLSNQTGRGAFLKTFKDKLGLDLSHTLEFKKTDKAYLWVAQRLKQEPGLNLAMDPYLLKNRNTKTYKSYIFAAGLLGLGFIFFIFSHVLTLWYLHQDIKIRDEKISQMYYQFFPNAQNIINPRFRVGQLIESSSQGGANPIWGILTKLDKAFNPKIFMLKALRWRPDILTLTLSSPDFTTLEKLELSLKNTGLKVTQTQSTNQQGQVIATLELSL